MQDNWLPGELSPVFLFTEYTVIFLEYSFHIVMTTDSECDSRERLDLYFIFNILMCCVHLPCN